MQQTFVNQVRDLHQPSTTKPMYNINTKLFHGPDVSCSTSTCHPAFNSPFSEFPMSWVPFPVFYFEVSAFRRRTCSLSQNLVMNLLASNSNLPSSPELGCLVLGKVFPSVYERNVQMGLHILSHTAAPPQAKQ